jgi:hypothetical protein
MQTYLILYILEDRLVKKCIFLNLLDTAAYQIQSSGRYVDINNHNACKTSDLKKLKLHTILLGSLKLDRRWDDD